MTQPIVDILKQGPRLTSDARTRSDDVNAAYLLVHSVIALALSRLPQAIIKGNRDRRITCRLDVGNAPVGSAPACPL